jgi:tRNA(fMet)-specific endonuclease VapC
MYLLDTDYMVLMQRGSGPDLGRLLQRMAARPDTDFFYPIVAFHEQMLGAHTYIARAKTQRDVIRGYGMLQQVLVGFSFAQVLPFDEPAARKFEELRSQRVRVGTMDLRIAAIALSKDMTVLTRNLVHFQAIPGVDVQDWTVPE